MDDRGSKANSGNLLPLDGIFIWIYGLACLGMSFSAVETGPHVTQRSVVKYSVIPLSAFQAFIVVSYLDVFNERFRFVLNACAILNMGMCGLSFVACFVFLHDSEERKTK